MRGHWMLGQHFERIDDLETFGENIQNNIRLGLDVTARCLAAADRVRTENWHKLDQVLSRCDALLTPCVPVEPFPAEQNYPTEIAGQPMQTYIDWLAPTFLFSMLQVPAASVPAGLTESALPVGLQIVAPRFQEGTALGIARVVQEIRPIGRPELAA
jgi:amidase